MSTSSNNRFRCETVRSTLNNVNHIKYTAIGFCNAEENKYEQSSLIKNVQSLFDFETNDSKIIRNRLATSEEVLAILSSCLGTMTVSFNKAFPLRQWISSLFKSSISKTLANDDVKANEKYQRNIFEQVEVISSCVDRCPELKSQK